MSDSALLAGQIVGIVGGIIAVLATAGLYWRAGKNFAWPIVIVISAFLLSTLGMIWGATAAAEGRVSVDTY